MAKWHLANVLLDKGALNYSSLPKGLFPFHQYYDSIITAFEEHLYESALYAVSQQRARLHFTIAEEHLTLFQHKFNNVEKEISQKTAVEFSVQYSFQKQTYRYPCCDFRIIYHSETKISNCFLDQQGMVHYWKI